MGKPRTPHAWLTQFFGVIFYAAARILRRLNKEWEPRTWSNSELRRWAALFEGEVINVSAWEDSDKAGRRYRDYFKRCSAYYVSNYGGGHGESRFADEIKLDLEATLPSELNGRFDVVFNHTALEHIYEVKTAFANLCAMTRDVVVVVVPFIQFLHWDEGAYSDYWRISPFALKRLFQENGLELVYFRYNENPIYPLYIFAIGSRRAERWRNKLPRPLALKQGEVYPGWATHRHKIPRGSATGA